MAPTSVRPFTNADTALVVSLWNRTLQRDPITAEMFELRTLRDPNFSPSGCLIAEGPSGPEGFVLAVAPGTRHRFAPPPGMGRIAGLGVLPAARRKKVGTGLAEAAFRFLKERKCAKVLYAAHEYWCAGLDKAYAEGTAFLAKHGFAEAGVAVAMGRLLYEVEVPAEVVEKGRELAAKGINTGPYDPSEEQALEDFFTAEFPEWRDFFHEKLERHDDLRDIFVARDNGKVIGYCQRLEADHVGPFGVSKEARNLGIGTVMLYALLDGLRARGYRFCWFGETGRAQPYYERAGFFITRRYSIQTRAL
jgi:ribosomal protein S18 acetylase RimI-like enzyme